MLQLTPTHYAQRPHCTPGSSPPDGVSQGHFNLTPHSRLGLALIPNYNVPTAPPVSHPRPLSGPAGPSRPVGLTPVDGRGLPERSPILHYSNPSTLNSEFFMGPYRKDKCTLLT
ncbi:unnamed protein product [Microthlaspi erraticum]|uniref:Uncharacterized protein n=1 Tax=Microthlaspi erraticum TaxID=1685480 RepID=A0A6D2K3D0_9BRAS|nr:unnamed protein product [Microthlaspi erraticum]